MIMNIIIVHEPFDLYPVFLPKEHPRQLNTAMAHLLTISSRQDNVTRQMALKLLFHS